MATVILCLSANGATRVKCRHQVRLYLGSEQLALPEPDVRHRVDHRVQDSFPRKAAEAIGLRADAHSVDIGVDLCRQRP